MCNENSGCSSRKSSLKAVLFSSVVDGCIRCIRPAHRSDSLAERIASLRGTFDTECFLGGLTSASPWQVCLRFDWVSLLFLSCRCRIFRSRPGFFVRFVYTVLGEIENMSLIKKKIFHAYFLEIYYYFIHTSNFFTINNVPFNNLEDCV